MASIPIPISPAFTDTQWFAERLCDKFTEGDDLFLEFTQPRNRAFTIYVSRHSLNVSPVAIGAVGGLILQARVTLSKLKDARHHVLIEERPLSRKASSSSSPSRKLRTRRVGTSAGVVAAVLRAWCKTPPSP